MCLDLLNKGCFPKWSQIFAVAESVMARILAADVQLYDHLKTVAHIKPTVNPKVCVYFLSQSTKNYMCMFNFFNFIWLLGAIHNHPCFPNSNPVCRLFWPQEFLMQLIHQERSGSKPAGNVSSKMSVEETRELLSDPLIFFRKWVGEVCCQVLILTLFLISSHSSLFLSSFQIYNKDATGIAVNVFCSRWRVCGCSEHRK